MKKRGTEDMSTVAVESTVFIDRRIKDTRILLVIAIFNIQQASNIREGTFSMFWGRSFSMPPASFDRPLSLCSVVGRES